MPPLRQRMIEELQRLGTDLEQSSAYPLRGAWRRSVPGSLLLDLVASSFLPASQGPQQCLPRQILGWIKAGLSHKRTSFLWRL